LATRVKAARNKRKRADDSVLEREFEQSRALRIVALVSILAVSAWLVAALFAPGLRYTLASLPQASPESEDFLNELAPLVNSKITRGNQIQILANGETFYDAEFSALQLAQQSIDIEAYIFHKGEVTRRLLEVLAERARNAVKVRLVLDSLGSVSMPKKTFKPLIAAGGRVEWYHPLRWNNWFLSNNRTHRELTIIDGSVAFVGGAGFADWWRFSKNGKPRWRDTLFRVQGEAVPSLQSVFVENWLEASGEILYGADYFPPQTHSGNTPALVIASTPSSGGSTRSRILFQTLLAAAKKSICITTPYFLPDRSMRQEMAHALGRGVRVRILVPGKHTDHYLTRSSGRSVYGDLLKAGAEIYEYQASMIHAKIMLIDEAWTVIGSTNLDNRSFGINDEVNVAALDRQLASTLTREFEQDLAQSHRVTLETWNDRPIYERVAEWIGWVVARQQ
jgi:cardiolipin synthase